MELGLGHRLGQAAQRASGEAAGRSGGRCMPSDATIPRACPPSSSRARTGSSAARPSRPCSRAGHAVVALVRTPDRRARSSSAGCRRPARDRVEIADRRRHAAGDARPRRWRASTRSSISWPSRATATAARTCAGSTPRGRATVVAAMTRRPASGASSTWARWASSTTRRSTTRARRRRPRRSSASPGLDWTILKPSLQFGEGDGFFNIIAEPRPDVARDRAGAGRRAAPLPADPRRRRGHGRRPLRSRIRRRSAGRSSSAGRATGPTARSPARSLTALGKRRRDRPDAGPAHLARRRGGRARPPAVPGRHRPAPPAAARQHRPARRHRPSRFGFEPRPMEGAPRLPPRRSGATSGPAATSPAPPGPLA